MSTTRPLIAVDTECTGLNPWGTPARWGFHPARPFAFSFCHENGNTEYYRFPVNPRTRQVLYDKDRALFQFLKTKMDNPAITWVLHNAAYDLRMMAFAGISVRGTIHDTLILTHVATGGSELTYALKPLGVKYLQYPDTDETDLQAATNVARREARARGYPVADKERFGRDPVKADYWMAPAALCERYAVSDAERTMLLFRTVYPTVTQDTGLLSVYRRELELFVVLQRMENRGVRVFPADLQSLLKFYEAYMAKQVDAANQCGGKGLNFRSHKQLTRIFYQEKGYAPRLNANGNPTLNGKVLAELSVQTGDQLAKAILEYRAASHTVSSFLSVYERWRVEENPHTWVLHPNFRQCGPVTGRLACSDPNLMQVASSTTGRARADIEYRPREAFGPRDGCVWYLPDYSQIEVWLFSFMSGEQAMMDALLAGHDFHGAIAQQVWGREPDFDARKPYYRKRAKLLMFCKLYGGGIKKVAFLLECPEHEAANFVHTFDAQLPGIQRFMHRMSNRAEREGKISNPFGRVYYLQPGFAYRAVNYLIQGTAADILKNAMIRLDRYFRAYWPDVALLLPLHDELVIEVPRRRHSKQLMREIISVMQEDSSRVGLPVPLPVGMKISTKRWASTTEVIL